MEHTIKKRLENPSPYVSASWLSKLTFWWMNPIFRIGSKRSLDAGDLYDAVPDDRAEPLADRLHNLLEKKRNVKAISGNLSFLWTLLGMFTRLKIFTGIMFVLWTIIKMAQPIILGYVMRYFDPTDKSVSSHAAYIYGGVLFILGFMQTFIPVLFMHVNQLITIRMRAAVSSLIYRKTLRLGQSSLSSITSGKIVNLMSTDVEKFQKGIIFLHLLWTGPIVLITVIWLLYREVNMSCLPGVGLLLVLTALTFIASKALGGLRYKIARWTDKRALMMNQLINGMRVIKMYCWEKPFTKIVSGLRGAEIRYVMRTLGIRGQTEAMTFTSGKLTACSILLTHYLLGNDMKADTVVRVILWAEEMRWIMEFSCLALQYGTEMMASTGRIWEFLNAEELQPMSSVISPGHVKVTDMVARWTSPIITNEKGKDSVTNHERQMDQNHTSRREFVLDNLTLEINPGDLVAIVGSVGAGKSSLIMTMLGEMPVESGSVDLAGKVAYVPQEAWIFSGSVQDNILFGQSFDHERFQSVIDATSLEKDLESFPHGSQSIVGENGHYLSGGQKARINLARAIYQDADIYLLDDPLSAVDAKVGRYLFQKCIRGTLEGKTRVLITHQLQFLRQVDCVYVIHEGRILASGPYEQVSQIPEIDQLFVQHEKATNNDKRMSIRRYSVSLSENELEEKTNVEDVPIRDDTEQMAKGSVGMGVYWQYLSAGYGVILLPVFLILSSAFQVIYNMTDWTLIQWGKDTEDGKTVYMIVGFIVGLLVFGSLRSFSFAMMTSMASRNLHNEMFRYLIRAPISFFDSNPVGRILNRFTRDTGFMDDILPQNLHTVLLYFSKFAGVMVFVSISNPWSLLITIPVLTVIIFLRHYCLKTIRDIKRLEAACRSPTFSHLSVTLQGLPVIRAFKMEKQFITTFYAHQDMHSSAWHMYFSGFRWFSMKIDWCVIIYLGGYIIVAFMISNKGADGANLGLSFLYIIALLGAFQYIMKITAEVESYMTSVERILHYTKLDQEAAEHTSVQPDPDWPANGTIHFDHLYLSYTHGQYVLKDINISIDKGEKIGVVGRTGAGKTSLLSCLFRLCEPNNGRVWIDGIDIGTLGLEDLRKNISVIPQDPVLFQASLRYNLDPFAEYSDDSIWKALEEVNLSGMINLKTKGLDTDISEAGSNFSVGQKQLVCLARAVLRNNKILVIDEATANVDLSSDRCIQATLRQRFKHCTVLSIAHRLNTVIDCDRILVMDQGEVLQFGIPYVLLQDKESIFSKMVHETGRGVSQMLHNMAKTSYQEKMCAPMMGGNKNNEQIMPSNKSKYGSDAHMNIHVAMAGFTNAAFLNNENMITYL